MVLLMGIAGSGKGTQGKLLASSQGYHIISTGELLRKYGSQEQQNRLKTGELFSDEEVTAIVDKSLSLLENPGHTILDGYPRTIKQAEWLLSQQEAGRFKLDRVLHLVASRQAVKDRLKDRARVDDHDQAIEARFNKYEQETLPILEFLKSHGVEVVDVNAEQPITDVHKEVARLCTPG